MNKLDQDIWQSDFENAKDLQTLLILKQRINHQYNMDYITDDDYDELNDVFDWYYERMEGRYNYETEL